MHLHILGICGTFMGGLAAIAKAAGHTVTGCDAQVYPPMSVQLEALGIELTEGFDADAARHRGEGCGHVRDRQRRSRAAIRSPKRCSTPGGPTSRARNGCSRTCCATNGCSRSRVRTARRRRRRCSRGSWSAPGSTPGFLIGGVPMNFGVSARLADSAFFVIEADEYDTAFFDKRSKFVHYRPRTAILNNLEFDHADIFADLAAIETQFHHLVRIVPRTGRLVVNGEEESLARVLARGCGRRSSSFPAPRSRPPRACRRPRGASRPDGKVTHGSAPQGVVRWPADAIQHGRHSRLERACGARRRAPRGRPGRRRASRRSPNFAASSGASKCAAGCAASPCTTISRIIRRPSRRRSTACAARRARRAHPGSAGATLADDEARDDAQRASLEPRWRRPRLLLRVPPRMGRRRCAVAARRQGRRVRRHRRARRGGRRGSACRATSFSR